MQSNLQQCDAYMLGVGTNTEYSVQPQPGQRICIKYLQWMVVAAHANDVLQVDILAATVKDRKTLIYVSPGAASILQVGAVPLDLPLMPGEYLRAYVNGAGAASRLSVIVWYIVEDVSSVAHSVEKLQAQQCDPWARLVGWC